MRCRSLISTLGSGRIAGIPWIVIVAATMLLVAHIVLTYTRFGRYVYMVGGNREAAEYSGVNVKLVIGTVMVIGAVCSGIAGMLGVAYFGSAQQNEFTPYLLDAIAAVVVGGTSLFGGRGGIGNTIVGLFVLGVLNNGLDHVQIDPFLKVLIRGLILLIALVINVYAQRLERERQGDGVGDSVLGQSEFALKLLRQPPRHDAMAAHEVVAKCSVIHRFIGPPLDPLHPARCEIGRRPEAWLLAQDVERCRRAFEGDSERLSVAPATDCEHLAAHLPHMRSSPLHDV